MRLGTENRREIILLAVLGILAMYSVSHWVFGAGATPNPATPPAEVAQTPVATKADTRKPRTLTKSHAPKREPTSVVSLDPTLRLDLLKSSEDHEYSGGKRNIFQAQAEEIPIPRPIVPAAKRTDDTGPPPPPPPPPINLKFYGFANKPGENRRIFLSSGDDVFIGSEGEIVNRRYRILHITNNSVEIEDVLNNNKQVIPLSQS